MRALILAVGVAAALAGATCARAAPTCDDIDGGTIRCGTPGAMPVGWAPSAERRLARLAAGPPDPPLEEALAAIAVVGGLLALFGLLPDFDGWQAGDWDRQESDKRERR